MVRMTIHTGSCSHGIAIPLKSPRKCESGHYWPRLLASGWAAVKRPWAHIFGSFGRRQDLGEVKLGARSVCQATWSVSLKRIGAS